MSVPATLASPAAQILDDGGLTVPEAARRARRHPQTIRGYIHAGRLPAYRVGDPTHGEFRIREADLALIVSSVESPQPASDDSTDALDALAAKLVADWPLLSADRKAELGALLAAANA